MIDLHLHLDGSLTPKDLLTMSRMTKTSLPTEEEEALASLMTFSGRGTLKEYLNKFRLPLSVMQSAESVEYAVRSLGDRLGSLGYEGAEVRFAPLLHTEKGAKIEEIVEGAVKGIKESKTPIKLLLCCMRGASEEANRRTIEAAATCRKDGVVGVDLAGAEALYPTEEYREIFSLASRFGLNITIHAGEAAGEDSVKAALDFGAKRIGHGVAARSEALLDRLAAEKIAIECCPTSNLQTGAVVSLKEHPIRRFIEKGIPCVLCSDNMTVSDTDLPREWEKVRTAFGWSEAIREMLEKQAKESAFQA